MKADKLTQKTIDAIQNAQSICIDYQNQNVSLEHLVYALLDQENGLIPNLIEKMGVDAQGLKKAVEAEIEKFPKVSGSGRPKDQVYVTPEFDKTLNEAEYLVQHYIRVLKKTCKQALTCTTILTQ